MLRSVGQIAGKMGVPIHTVKYITRSRGIAAVAKIGNAYAYDEPAVEQIESEIRRQQAAVERLRRRAPADGQRMQAAKTGS